jgi:hypothetical protein
LTVLDRALEIECGDETTHGLLDAVYGAMVGEPASSDLSYSAGMSEDGAGFFIVREKRWQARTADADEFLTLFNDDVTIELQKLRPDLYFLHAGAVERGGKAVLLAAEAGGGKSTTTWALLHHGFRYLSDELAPLELESMTVLPFLRALCLKSRPPEPYGLREAATVGSRVTHLPVQSLPGGVVNDPVPVGALVFVNRESGPAEPRLRRLRSARAAQLLYANALNPLAHADDGLAGALRIVERIPCLELVATDLQRGSELLTDTLDALVSD